MSHATDRSYFEQKYASGSDPWGFDSLWYEHRKYDLTMAALPRQEYRRAFEPGCANGALTERLAGRCAEVIAQELVPAPALRAQERLREQVHVEVVRGRIPDDWPPGYGDLVILSEVAYYLSDSELARLGERLEDWLVAGGHVLAVHYTGRTNYPQTAETIERWLCRLPMLRRRVTLSDERFELGVWERIQFMDR